MTHRRAESSTETNAKSSKPSSRSRSSRRKPAARTKATSTKTTPAKSSSAKTTPAKAEPATKAEASKATSRKRSRSAPATKRAPAGKLYIHPSYPHGYDLPELYALPVRFFVVCFFVLHV